MKVKDLIKKLQKVEDQEAIVFIEDSENFSTLCHNKDKSRRYSLSRAKEIEELDSNKGLIIKHTGQK